MAVEQLERRELLSIQPVSAMFSPTNPGNLIYDQYFRDTIATSAEIDQFSIDLPADHTVSLLADGDNSLQAKIELIAPGGTSLGVDTAAALSGKAALGGISTTQAGTYTIAVSGEGGSHGSYGVRVLLNSAIEAESVGANANDSAASAQSLESVFVELGGGVAELAAVSGSLPGHSESFESGRLDARWETYTPTQGHTEITSLRGAADGNLALLLGWAYGGDDMEEPQEAIWTVDMAGLDDPTLNFQAAAWNHRTQPFNGPFAGHYNASGVAISQDGQNWYPVADVAPGEEWTAYSVDLAEEADSAGISLDGEIQIKFQRWGQPWGDILDGLAFDAISIGTSSDNEDWYAFSLQDGEPTSLSLDRGQLGYGTLELYDSNLNLLAASVSTADGDGLIQQFRDSTMNGTSDTYYAKVTGRGMDYSLGVLRGADYHADSDGSQELSSDVPALGGVFWERPNVPGPAEPPTPDVYQFAAVAGDQLRIGTQTPTEKDYFFPSRLDPMLRLRGPDGTIVAENDNSAGDGFNSLIEFAVSQTGTYTLEVASVGYTSGEYLLNLEGATGPMTPLQVENTYPADGTTITDPSTYVVQYSHPLAATSIVASDLKVDGQDATAARLLDGRTVEFTLPAGLTEAVHTVSIPAGAIQDLSGRPAPALTATFQPDVTAPQVLSSTLHEGDVLGLGTLSIDIQFTEPLLESALDAGDVQLVGQRTGAHEVAHFAYDAASSTLNLRFADLGDDAYTLTLTSGSDAFRDPAGHGLDGDVVIHFSVQAEDAPLTDFQPLGVLGNLAYRAEVAGYVADSTDDTYLVDLNAQQTVTLLLNGKSTLTGTVELTHPNGSVIATATAAGPGENAEVAEVVAPVAGLYRISVRGAGGTTGDYELQTLLNVVREDDALDESIPENLDASFRSLPGGSGERVVLLGEMHALGESFESNGPSDGWTWSRQDLIDPPSTFTSSEWGSVDGDKALMMQGVDKEANTVSARWTVDISELTNPTLSFWHASWEGAGEWSLDMQHDINMADGIILATIYGQREKWDGTYFPVTTQRRLIWLPPDQEVGEWVHYSLDLEELTEQYGEPLGPVVQLTFQRFGDQVGLPDSGRGWDAVVLSSSDPIDDWYELTLEDGQAASVVMASDGLPSENLVEIYDHSGNLLAVGESQEAGVASIDTFRDTTSDGMPNTYRIRAASVVTTPTAAYSLTVTRDSAIDLEPNNETEPQTITPGLPVSGHVSALEGDHDAYQFAVNAGATITLSTATPSVGTGTLANHLDPRLELFAPDGTLVAADDNSGSGSNVTLSHVATNNGVYTVKLAPVAASAGNYVLTVDASSPAQIPFEVLHVERVSAEASTIPSLEMRFNNALQIETLAPSDIRVNGVPVESIEVIDARTIRVAPKVLTSGNWTVEVSANALSDLRGAPVESFAEALTVSIPDAILPGGLLDETSFMGKVNSSGQADHWNAQVTAGQMLTVMVSGDDSLPLNLRLLAPDGTQVATVSGAAGESIALEHTASSAGTYTVVIAGVDSATGSYEGKLVLDALVERETTAGIPNNTMATAEDLDGTFIDLGDGSGQRAAARGHLPGTLNVYAQEDFEGWETLDDPPIPPGWTSRTTRTRFSQEPTALPGIYVEHETWDSYLTLGSTVTVTYVEYDDDGNANVTVTGHENDIPHYYEANWPVDLSNATGSVMLTFDSYFLGSVPYNAAPFSGSFSDRVDASGIAISNDGVNWHPVWDMPDQDRKIWKSHSVNLTNAAAAAGITLDSNTWIRFQYYAVPDEDTIAPEVRLDNLVIASEEATEDWYRFSLADGQTASLMADSESNLELSLYDGQSNLLAHGVSAINAKQFINQFADSTTNGQPNTYYVRISGAEGPYSLVVSQDAALDMEPNRDFVTAQDVTGATGVLGNLGDRTPWADSADPNPQGDISRIADFAGPDFHNQTPSSANIAVGDEVVVSVNHKEEAENYAIWGAELNVYDKATGHELAHDDLATLLGVGMAHDITYPSVNYDANSGRFFVAFVEFDVTEDVAWITIGVSKTSSPARREDWDVFQYDLTRELVGSGLSEAPSYPFYFEMALSDEALWISGVYQAFDSWSSDNEHYAGIVALDKKAMLGGQKADILFERQFEGDHVTPMVQDGSNLIQYFASADPYDGSSIKLYAVSFIGELPNLQTFDITVPEYTRAGSIYQNDTARPILAGTARIRTGAWHDGSLWLAHTVADPADETEAIVRWYEFETNAFPYGMPTLIQTGDIDAGSDVSAFSPALSVNADAQVGLAYLTAGQGHFVNAHFTGRIPSDPQGEMRPSRLLAEGQSVYRPGGSDTIAWQDEVHYQLSNQQSLVVDPGDGASFWMLGEYAANDGNWDTRIGAFQIGTPGGEDWYAVDVASGENIELESFTPGDTWLAASQRLDVTIELYAPDGTLVMTNQDGAEDGRNAKLVHTAAQSGRYRIRVLADNASRGEYYLSIDGPIATNSAPEVVSVSPPINVTYGQLPESITVTFSEPLRPDSVDAGDLQVGGKPALDVEMVSASALRFTVDPSANAGTGNYSLVMAANAVTDIVGLGNRPYQASIELDASSPRVAELLVNGAPMPAAHVLNEGKVEFQVRFDEAMFLFPGSITGPLSPQAEGIELVGQLSGKTLSPDDVQYDSELHTLTITFDILSEDVYSLILVSGDGTFEDFLGNSLDGNGNGVGGDDYVVEFAVDMVTGAGLPLSHQAPFGSLIHGGAEPFAVLHDANDLDEYTFYAQAGQTIAFVAQPARDNATVQVELVGLGVSAASTAPGEAAYLAPYRVGADGVFTLRLSANTATQVALNVSLNAAIETLDASWDSPMAIDNTVIGTDTWERWAVLGTLNAGDVEDTYTLDLTGWAGKSIDIVVAGDDTVRLADAKLRLFDADGNKLAIGRANSLGSPALNYDLGILDFEVPADGTYTVRLADAQETNYSIVVTADAHFDTELRNNGKSPRVIDAGDSALGYLSPEAPLLFVAEWGFDDISIRTVNAATGKTVNIFDAPAPPASPAYGVNLAFDGTKLYYSAGGPSSDQPLYVLDARDGTVLDAFETAETNGKYKSLGLAYLDGELFVADVTNTAFSEIDVYDAETGVYQRSFAIPVLLGLAGDAAGGFLYGVDPITFEIVRINPDSGTIVKTMPSGVAAPEGMAMIGDELFVSHSNGFGASQILVAYDIDTMVERRRLNVPIGEHSLISGLGGDGLLARFQPEGGDTQSNSNTSFASYQLEEPHESEWRFSETDHADNDESHICVTSFGVRSYDDDPDVIPPVTDRISPDAQDPLELDERENNDTLALAQPVPLGFADSETTAVLVSGAFSDETDVDIYQVQLNAGDILAVRASGAAASASVKDYRGETLIALSNVWAPPVYPESSPLFSDARLSLAHIAEAPGTYFVKIKGHSGSGDFGAGAPEYFLELDVLRPGLESEPIGTHQILYLDFDGASLDSSFQGVEETTLSPLVDFLPRWGLDPETDLDPVIDAIIAQVERSLSQEIRASGVNGDYCATSIPGQFDIEILNSRDHGEQFGNPNVTRVIIGGTIEELGIRTIGIAQSIDVGNFETEESAVVLLDMLSATPDVYSKTLNAFPIDPSSNMIELIGAAVGNITAHEAGHTFGNWHTDRDNDVYGIMEPGGRMDGIIGIGPDGIFGTEDDLDVPFIYDRYSPHEIYGGFENTAATIAYGLSTGMSDAEQDGPTLLSVDLNTPTNDHLDIHTLTVLFSEPVDTTSATLPANYRLIEAGPNGVFEDGLGDDRTIGVGATMDGEDQVLLTVASSGASLPLGRYQLTVFGNGTGVTDLYGNTVGQNSQYPNGRDMSVEFQVTVPTIGDWYRMSVSRGDVVTLWTETPYDASESIPLNDLDARLLVISPTTGRIFHDLDSDDGKNPRLQFKADESGDYLIRIASTSGQGEYVLRTEVTEGAPSIIAHSPAETVANSLDSIVVSFSHDMDTSSFSLASDVVRFDGPGGAITPSGFNWRTPRDLEIAFPTQTAGGNYEFVLAPTILSVSGKAIDQDGDGTPGETSDDQYEGSFSLISATDFGKVLYDHLTGLNPSQEDLVYRLQATHAGFLTVLADPPGEGTLQFTLHNEATGVEFTSGVVDGKHRIDLPLPDDGFAILRVSGTATDANVTLANLVDYSGTTVTVHGTGAADPFVLDASDGMDLSIKGVPYHFDANDIGLIQFDGGDGADTATLTGTTDDEEALLYPDQGEMTGNGWKVTVDNVVSIELIGGGGYDLVQMNDSAGDDHYESAPGLTTMSGTGFQLTAKDFSVSHAYARAGGNDSAVIHGPENSKVKFKSDNEGGWSKLYGSGFFSRAKFFEVAEAHSHGENSLARLFDSKGDDTFTGQMDESRMVGNGYDVTIHGFSQLIAYSIAGGNDTAVLIDTTLNDEVRFRPHKTQMYDLETRGDVYTLTVRAFDEVHAKATEGGYDKAKLHDTAGDDLFEASGNVGRLSTMKAQMELLYEAVDFEFVKAYCSAGTDRAEETDPIDFLLAYEGDWE